MTKQDSHQTELSLQHADYVAWRVARGKRRQKEAHKKSIFNARPRQRDGHHQ